MPGRRVAERLPHVHDDKADLADLLFPDKPVELVHAGLGAIFAAEPDRPMPLEVADDDSIGVPLANRDLVDADDLRPRCAGTLELRAHVLLVELLDRVPVEAEFLGDVLDRRGAATPTHIVGEALRVERIVGQERQPLALHCGTLPAVDSPHLQIDVDAKLTTRQIAHLPARAVVESPMHRCTGAAMRFFARRARKMIRVCGSPKRPRTAAPGRNPGNAYPSTSSRRRRLFGIGKSCQISATSKRAPSPMKIGLAA